MFFNPTMPSGSPGKVTTDDKSGPLARFKLYNLLGACNISIQVTSTFLGS